MQRCQDVIQELKLCVARKNKAVQNDHKTQILQNINPFDTCFNRDSLFNLSTGKAASNNVVEFLLNVKNKGNVWRKTLKCDLKDL